MWRYILAIFLISGCLYATDYPIEETCFAKYLAQEFSGTKGEHTGSYPNQPLPALQVYMSFSVPTYIWLRLSEDIKPRGGVFILRGFFQNSLYKTEQKLKELKAAGVSVPILIGSAPFEKHAITRVPTVVYAGSKISNPRFSCD
ncbi:MAG: hypothetical protein H7A39_02105 [Chlamydiales bacterium]|nr:hypothetical protein [Chlamydiales bacterium]